MILIGLAGLSGLAGLRGLAGLSGLAILSGLPGPNGNMEPPPFKVTHINLSNFQILVRYAVFCIILYIYCLGKTAAQFIGIKMQICYDTNMQIHEMNLQPKYYDFIKDGTKRIELRLFDEKRQKIQLGDTIEFYKSDTERFRVEVIGLLRYKSFEDLFEDFDISILADKSMTKPELLAVLGEFYTPAKQAELGVLGIRLKLLD